VCDKCVEIDKKIGHYKGLAELQTDQQTLHGIGKLISELDAQKVALHSEQKE